MIVVFDRSPQVVCQCIAPCLMPFLDGTGTLSPLGCTRAKGHAPPCSIDMEEMFALHETATRFGPVLIMREVRPGRMETQPCQRCGRRYAATVGLLEEVEAVTDEDAEGIARVVSEQYGGVENAHRAATPPSPPPPPAPRRPLPVDGRTELRDR